MSSLPSLAPPSFPLAPPVRPLAPHVDLRPPVSSLATPVVPLSFPASAILSSGPSVSSPFLPSYASAPVAPILCSPVASFPVISSSSPATVISWSLPAVITCSAPSLFLLAARTHSLVLLLVSLSSFVPPPPHASSWLPSVPSFPSAPTVPPSSFVSFGDSPSFPDVSAGLGASTSRGTRPVCQHGSFFDFADASGSCDDMFLYRGFDDYSVKGEKDSPALGKADFCRAFHEVVSLITSFFPQAKPPPSSSSVESYPWMDVYGTSQRHDPHIFLSDKLSLVSEEVNEKFRNAADDKKQASTALPHWGDVYHVGDLSDFHKASKVNEFFQAPR